MIENYEDQEISELSRDLLIGELATLNQSRYEFEAQKFLQAGELFVQGRGFTLRYRLEDRFCMSAISYDAGTSYSPLGGRRLDLIDGFDELRVFWEFADKEARVFLRR